MTVQSTVSRNDYTGNGTANTYPYTYRVRDESHLRLIVTDLDGVETVLIITTDYTVTGVNASSGGNIVLVNNSQAWLTAGNLSTGYGLSIIRKRPILQETDIRNQGEYYPEGIEDEFDNSREIDQQQQEEIDRCVKLPEGREGDDSTLPDLVSGEYIRVNAAGTGFELGTPSVTSFDYNGNIDVGLYAARSASPSTNDIYLPTDKQGMICICYSSGTWTDFKMRYFGLDAAKAASPKAGDSFLATDVGKIYHCFVDGTWTTLTNGTKGTNIASATTCDIGAATGEFVDISGTTTITGLGTVGAGAVRKVRFLAALTLTHNATSLILPGATNITTAADDTAEFISLGSGNWICQNYKKASGLAIVAAAVVVPAFENAFLHVRDEKSAGTGGGSSGSSSFVARDLNTVVTNQISGASLATNQITLPAGTYYIDADAPAAGNIDGTVIKLRNTTDSTDTIIGRPVHTVAPSIRSLLSGRFTIAGEKVFELQHYVVSGGTYGTAGNRGLTEIYADVRIWKVA